MPKPPPSSVHPGRDPVDEPPEYALLARYVPPAVLVDEALNPLRSLGNVRDLLADAGAGERVLTLSPRLLDGLRDLVASALATGTVVPGPVIFPSGERAEALRAVVVPTPHRPEAWLCFEAADPVFYDALTELPNLRLFREHLKAAVRRAERHKGSLAVLHVDLGRLRGINGELGRDAGDELLQKVAQRLQGELRSVDVLARIGGEDFGVVLEDVGLTQDATRVCHKLIAALTRPLHLGEGELFCGGNIGAALYPEAGLTDDGLLSAAVHALQEARQLGRNHYAFAAPIQEAATD
jgi:diguanylate cyclase (GGDEF)-like protein